MHAKIDRDSCISCGQCIEICPEVFYMADDGLADVHLDPIPKDMQQEAAEAGASCPVSVISVTE